MSERGGGASEAAAVAGRLDKLGPILAIADGSSISAIADGSISTIADGSSISAIADGSISASPTARLAV